MTGNYGNSEAMFHFWIAIHVARQVAAEVVDAVVGYTKVQYYEITIVPDII